MFTHSHSRSKWLAVITTLMLAALALNACVTVAPAQPMSPADVVLAAGNAQNAGDVDRTMSFYADDFVNTVTYGGETSTSTGLADFRAAIEYWANEWNGRYQADIVKVEGNAVTTIAKYWNDDLRRYGVTPWVGTELITVQEGKIKTATLVGSAESEAALLEAMAKEQIIQEYVRAFNARDLEAALALYTDDATITYLLRIGDLMPDATTKGKDGIRQDLEALWSIDAVLRLVDVMVRGDTVTATAQYWNASFLVYGHTWDGGTYTWEIRDGKIASQTWTSSDEDRDTTLASLQSEAVVTGFMAAMNANDLDAMMAMVTDDATWTLELSSGEPLVYAGKEQVREWLGGLVSTHIGCETQTLRAYGGTVTAQETCWDDEGKQMGVDFTVGTGIYTLRDGKVAAYTGSFSAESNARYAAALALEANKALVRQAIDQVWNQGNLDAVDELYYRLFARYDPTTPWLVGGRDALKQLVTMYRTAFPNLTLAIQDIQASADRVTVRVRAQGTQQGEFMGIAATGQPVDFPITSVHLINGDSRIYEEFVEYNLLALLQQLGATALPTPEGTHGTVEVNGIQMYYEIHGQGEPLLLLHGGIGDAAILSNQIAALSQDYQVFAMDSRGQGRTTDSDEPITYPQMGADVIAFMDAMKIEQASVVGWSDGGMIGLDLAVRYPERVKRLVAYGAGFTAEGNITEFEPVFIGVVFQLLGDLYQRVAPDPAYWPVLLEKIGVTWSTEIVFTMEELASISVPTLILDGELEEVIKPEHTKALAAAIPSAQLILMPGVGHWAPWEQPAEFNRIVLDFLKAQ